MELVSTSNWFSAPWLGFDTETTGVRPTHDRVVTAALVERSPAGRIVRVDTWLADPGVPIPTAAAQIHGITTAHARKHGRPPAEVLDQINQALADHLSQGHIVVVFNAGYDLPLLAADSKRHGVRTLEQRLGGEVAPIADPLVLDRAVDRFRKGKRTLDAMARHYGIAVPADTHQAHVDSELALEVLAALLARQPQLAEMTAADLQSFQREAHRQWAANFQKFLASKGRQTRISPTWF